MIEVYDVECENHNEVGNLLNFRCPKCGDKMAVAVGRVWWSTKCSCGFTWYADIRAYTEDDEKE